jgi:chromosome segregation ATPase
MGGSSPPSKLLEISMTETNERLARVETQVGALIEAQTELRDDMKALVSQMASLTTALTHPDQFTDKRLRMLEQRADRAEGGGRVLLWLQGGGNLLGLISLLGALVWLSHHMKW